MAKVKVKFDPAFAARKLFLAFNKIKEEKELKDAIGIATVKRVKAAARVGKPLNDTGKFPSLAKITKIRREYLSRFNAVGRSYKNRKSNLTFTGQLIRSIKYSRGRGPVVVFVGDTKRKPYRTGPNSRARRTPTNNVLNGFLIDKGFVLYTAKGIKNDPRLNKRITTIVKRALRRALKKNLDKF